MLFVSIVLICRENDALKQQRAAACCEIGTRHHSEVAMVVRSERIRQLIRQCVGVAATTLVACLTVPSASAGDNWVFRRSYFSHVLPPEVQARYPVPESRSAYRLPLVDLNPSISIQGIYRYNSINIYDGIGSYDNTIYGQLWLQVKP
jgi:hypothetical protein